MGRFMAAGGAINFQLSGFGFLFKAELVFIRGVLLVHVNIDLQIQIKI